MLNVCIPAQVAPYPKRPLRQRVTHLTPLLSRDSYMYNEIVLIDGQINDFFFRIQWSNLKCICLRNSLICKSYFFLFWILNISCVKKRCLDIFICYGVRLEKKYAILNVAAQFFNILHSK